MSEAEPPVLDAAGARAALLAARHIAIVGASPSPWRPSHSVMRYLLDHGYWCTPVTPKTDEVLGQRTHPDLEAAVEAIGVPFDIVDVFRRSEYAPDIARSAVTLGCGTLWLQLGVVNAEAARIAVAGGVQVVMDRCTAIEHRYLHVEE